ncbi:ABC transporter permease [Nocardioides montaniterrae]
MIAFTLRALRARPWRLAMSTLAVTLAVGFVAGVLTFGHGLSTSFHTLVTGSTPDAVVRADYAKGLTESAQPTTLDAALVRRLAALPEVARADGEVQATGLTVLASDGHALGGAGGPTIAVGHDDAPNMDGRPMLDLGSGRWPAGPHEVVLDADATKAGGYRLGDAVKVLMPGGAQPERLTLVGTATFSGGGTAGSTLVVLSTPAAQHWLLGGKRVFTRIALTAAPGVTQSQLVAAASPRVPAGYLAVSGDTVAQQAQDLIGGFLDAISAFLLIFAVIAVVVAAFIIANAFTILVAQRTRELALLRALGASRRQVVASVEVEASIVGVVASVLGVALGWVLARVLAAAFAALGLHITTSTLVLTPGSVVAGFAVGIGMTLCAAYVPARRAGRIAPLAAIRNESAPPARASIGRSLLGAGALLAGIGCVAIGFAGLHPQPGSPALWVGFAAVLWLVGAAALVPLAVGPLLWLCRIVWSRLFGTPGRLAADNARRDPRRTGATASALMIGLALVSTIAVLAASLNATIARSVDQHFSSDFRIEGANHKAFPVAVGDRVAAVAGVAVVSREQDVPVNYVAAGKAGWTIGAGVDDHYDATHGVQVLSAVPVPGPLSVRVTASFAQSTHLRAGDDLGLVVGSHRVKVRIAAVVSGHDVTAQVLVPLRAITAAGVPRQDSALTVVMKPGADPARVRDALEAATEATPYVAVFDKHQFTEQLHKRVDNLMNMIYGLLALAIVIAVLGIVNTLGLSILERTREIGLLRAVGMTRAQVRRMVTLESIAIALVGALIGIGLGVVVGVLLRQALADDLTALGVPIGGLVGFAGVAVVIGVLAAVGPAIRAGRMDPLSAAADE